MKPNSVISNSIKNNLLFLISVFFKISVTSVFSVVKKNM